MPLSSVSTSSRRQLRHKSYYWRSESILLIALLVLISCSVGSASRFSNSAIWGVQRLPTTYTKLYVPRGGASAEEDEEYDEEEESEDDEESEDEDSDEEESEDEEESDDEEEEETGDQVRIEVAVQKFDEPLAPSPMINMYATFGVLLFGRKFDLLSPPIVRLARCVIGQSAQRFPMKRLLTLLQLSVHCLSRTATTLSALRSHQSQRGGRPNSHHVAKPSLQCSPIATRQQRHDEEPGFLLSVLPIHSP